MVVVFLDFHLILIRRPLITNRSTCQLPMRQSNIPPGEAKLNPGTCDANDPGGRMELCTTGMIIEIYGDHERDPGSWLKI